MYFDGKVKSRVVSSNINKKDTKREDLVDNIRKQREIRNLDKKRLTASNLILNSYRCYLQRKHSYFNVAKTFTQQIEQIKVLRELFRSQNKSFNVPIQQLVYLCRSLTYIYDFSMDVSNIQFLAVLLMESINNNSNNYEFNILYYCVSQSQTFIITLSKIIIIFLDITMEIPSTFPNHIYSHVISALLFEENDISDFKAHEVSQSLTTYLFKFSYKMLNILIQSNTVETNPISKCIFKILSIHIHICCASSNIKHVDKEFFLIPNILKFHILKDTNVNFRDVLLESCNLMLNDQMIKLPECNLKSLYFGRSSIKQKILKPIDSYVPRNYQDSFSLSQNLVVSNIIDILQSIATSNPTMILSLKFYECVAKFIRKFPLSYYHQFDSSITNIDRVTNISNIHDIKTMDTLIDHLKQDLSHNTLPIQVPFQDLLIHLTSKSFILKSYDNLKHDFLSSHSHESLSILYTNEVYYKTLTSFTSINKKSNQFTNIEQSILNVLAFSDNGLFCKRLWSFICLFGDLNQLSSLFDIDVYSNHSLRCQLVMSFSLLCIVYRHRLSAMDDDEFFNDHHNFSLESLNGIILVLKRLLKAKYWDITNFTNSIKTINSEGISLIELEDLINTSVITKLFNDLYLRQERRKFLEDEAWHWPNIDIHNFELDNHVNPNDDIIFPFKHEYCKYTLSMIPQVIPFKLRLTIFRDLLKFDHNGLNSNHFHIQQRRVLELRVRRGNLIEDTFVSLSNRSFSRHELKQKMYVEFISETGLDEAGIDGGGLFKDFIDNFSKEAFNPTYGIFSLTSQQLLSPNPNSHIVDSNHLQFFYIFGLILGKAVYEGILSEPQFSSSFINILLGRANQLDDLYLYDEQLYKSLMNLKKSSESGENISNLDMTFVVDRQEFGIVTSDELIPGGANIKVTNENLRNFIHQLAHYKLNKEIKQQSIAFLQGFRMLIHAEWIRLFNPIELQMIISGERKMIDIQEFRKHVTYFGYHDSQPFIQWFWEVISEMTLSDQGMFLKFVTSCPRPPLGGFQLLHPKFCIQEISFDIENPRLPSSATCMNLLKLPRYKSKEQLREKLLYAISSNSGFELS